MKLSIVIPTLNESQYLDATLANIFHNAQLPVAPEVIVSDSGSKDATVATARPWGVRVLQDVPYAQSRAEALNRGAACAGGQVLLFLDADTIVPPGYDRAIAKVMQNHEVVGGAFEFQLDGDAVPLRLVEWVNRARYRIWPRYYGDQGIFASKESFQRINGYPRRRILEASDFCRTMARIGRLVLIKKYMRTSARRFLEGGVYRVFARDIGIWWLDLIGRPTERFAEAYQESNRQRNQT